MLLQLLVLVAICAVFSYDVLVEITSHTQKIGVFFEGELYPDENVTLPEQLLWIVEPNNTVYEGAIFNTSLTIKSSDFKTRVRVDFTDESAEKPEQPFGLSFHNLVLNDRHSNEPVELKHSTSGYVWIDPGHVVAHYTAENHPFTIYDSDKKEIFTVVVAHPVKDEL